jgi:hypothetical protein
MIFRYFGVEIPILVLSKRVPIRHRAPFVT